MSAQYMNGENRSQVFRVTWPNPSARGSAATPVPGMSLVGAHKFAILAKYRLGPGQFGHGLYKLPYMNHHRYTTMT